MRLIWREEMVQEQSNSHHHHHHLQQQTQQLAKYGGGGGGGGGGNGAATGVARASRKNKPKKIPQRGLGVAQLEKLRIEEQKKMGAVPAVPATPSSHALNSGGGLYHLPTLHHPPPPPHPLSALSRPAADGGVHCGFTPVLWSPLDPTKHPYKRSLCPQPPLPMVSTGLSLTASSSHPTEPPSNQMYSSRSSAAAPAPAPATAEEERETAGVDRSWPFMFEGMTMAAAAFRTTSKALLPPPVPPFAARTASESGLADSSPDLSRFEFRATNYFSAYTNYSDWTSEFAHGKSSKENGRGRDAAFLTLSSQPAHLMKQPHVVPSIPIQEYNDFSVGAMPPQGSVPASSSSRPFYSFLPVGPVRCEKGPSECKSKTDVPEGGIDLELKLWKG